MKKPPKVPIVRKRFRRGAYLLPSLFTIGNVLLGFYAVVRGFRGDFHHAALLIFVAGVLDGLDGRIARLTGTESEFGREFDSLADVLTFGFAPALLAFFWGLHDLGRVGWLVPFFYLVCGATRLARFNVAASTADKRYFAGLPSPVAAGCIASLLLVLDNTEWRLSMSFLMLAALVVAGTLMVSTFRYPSFKQIDLRERWSYRVALPLATVMLVLAIDPTAFLLTTSWVYALIGPATWITGRIRSGNRKSSRTKKPNIDSESIPTSNPS